MRRALKSFKLTSRCPGRTARFTGGHLIRAAVHNIVNLTLHPLERIALEQKLEPNGLVGLFPRTR